MSDSDTYTGRFFMRGKADIYSDNLPFQNVWLINNRAHNKNTCPASHSSDWFARDPTDGLKFPIKTSGQTIGYRFEPSHETKRNGFQSPPNLFKRSRETVYQCLSILIIQCRPRILKKVSFCLIRIVKRKMNLFYLHIQRFQLDSSKN